MGYFGEGDGKKWYSIRGKFQGKDICARLAVAAYADALWGRHAIFIFSYERLKLKNSKQKNKINRLWK